MKIFMFPENPTPYLNENSLENLQKPSKRQKNHAFEQMHYLKIMQKIGDYPLPIKIRMRLAILLLFITGAQVSKVLKIQKKQVKPLFENPLPYLTINHKKYGSNYKAFLTQAGRELVNQRKNDYELALQINPESKYLFSKFGSSEKTISRELFTTQINRLLKQLGEEEQRRFTTSSFKKGNRTFLWQSSEDIKLVPLAFEDVKSKKNLDSKLPTQIDFYFIAESLLAFAKKNIQNPEILTRETALDALNVTFNIVTYIIALIISGKDLNSILATFKEMQNNALQESFNEHKQRV